MKRLNEIERGIWINFHEFAYKDDLELAGGIMELHPRWAIISGYYAMHDIAKLYLGKIYSMKISGANIHKKTVYALEKVLKENKIADDVLSLLKNAEEKIREFGIEDVSYLLRLGERERGRVQYYAPDSFSHNPEYAHKARRFFEDIVLVFVKIMEGIIDAG